MTTAVSIACDPDCPPSFEADPVWYRRIEYPRDLARGYDGHEDQASPGWFEVELPIDGVSELTGRLHVLPRHWQVYPGA